jgi:hypothetical protein
MQLDYLIVNSTIGGAIEIFDYIYDKGLLDTLFCNEGWNTPVVALFLVEQGNMVGLKWQLDVVIGAPLSNSNNSINTTSYSSNDAAAARVSISIAQKISAPLH